MWLVNSKCAVDGEDGDNEYLLNPMTLMIRCAQFSEASLGPSPASVLVTISRASLPSAVSQQAAFPELSGLRKRQVPHI